MFTRRHRIPRRPLSGITLAAVTAFAIAASAPSASAQGLFDFFFGSPRTSPNSYSDPNPPNGRPDSGPRYDRARRSPIACACATAASSRSSARAARTRRRSAARSARRPAPSLLRQHASITRSASDGTRYADLPNAFVYRDRLVADCTCNGKDAFGLVTTTTNDDPTLRPGDIVATEQRVRGL